MTSSKHLDTVKIPCRRRQMHEAADIVSHQKVEKDSKVLVIWRKDFSSSLQKQRISDISDSSWKQSRRYPVASGVLSRSSCLPNGETSLARPDVHAQF